MLVGQPENLESFPPRPMPTRQYHNHNREHEQGRERCRVRGGFFDEQREVEAIRVARAVASLQPNQPSVSERPRIGFDYLPHQQVQD